MRILYIGGFDEPYFTEVHIADTLETMGHSVTRFQENKVRDNFWLDSDYDLVIWTRHYSGFVHQADIDYFRKSGVPTVSIHLDLYMGLLREEGLRVDPFWKTDFVFTADGDPKSAENFKQYGINHHWLKPGVYKHEAKMVKTPEFLHDIIFVGKGEGYHKEWPYRVQLLNFLRDTYGDQFEHIQNVRNSELNKLYSETKIVIGDSLCLPGHINYWSDRIYETTGRGGFIIHPFIEGLQDEFKDRNEVLFYKYGDFTELKGLIDFYLVNDRPREIIRERGFHRTKTTHTYEDRMKQMFEVINAN